MNHIEKYSAEQLCCGVTIALLAGSARVKAAYADKCLVLTVQLTYKGAYGMGEKFNGLNQKGNTVINRVEEQFCHQGDKTYCSTPFFVTDSGFALYAKTDEVTSFSFGEGSIRVGCPTSASLWIGGGEPACLIRSYMLLTGPVSLPPKWAFAPWISANHWNTQAQVEQQIQKLTQHGYPASVLVIEAWSDEATFYIFRGARYAPKANGTALTEGDFDYASGKFWPDPQGMIRRLHAAGLHLVLWQVPVYKKQQPEENTNLQNELDRADAVQRGLCVKNRDGTPYTIPQGHWFAGSMLPDFTNPETRLSWFAKRRYLLEMGVDGFKTDGGEFVCAEDVRFSDGTTGKSCQNRYAQDYVEAYSDFIGGSRVLFSRAGYTGQQKTPCLWAGDHQSVNEELKDVLSAGLSAAMSGIPFWGFDIAGFAGPLPTPDLYRRATMLACFSPIMQWHSEPDGGQFREQMPGAEGDNERSPWNMEKVWEVPGFSEEIRFWHRLRMNLLPYLYTTAQLCAEQIRPMMRPLVYEWPQDPRAVSCTDEYLLGESLLVAPLMEEEQKARTVYLPQGRWYGLFDHKRYTGGTVLAKTAQPFPVFVREGCGLSLMLDSTKKLGCDVGNGTDAVCPIHFLLAGESGHCFFREKDKIGLSLTWTEQNVRCEGNIPDGVTWEFISED